MYLRTCMPEKMFISLCKLTMKLTPNSIMVRDCMFTTYIASISAGIVNRIRILRIKEQKQAFG